MQSHHRQGPGAAHSRLQPGAPLPAAKLATEACPQTRSHHNARLAPRSRLSRLEQQRYNHPEQLSLESGPCQGLIACLPTSAARAAQGNTRALLPAPHTVSMTHHQHQHHYHDNHQHMALQMSHKPPTASQRMNPFKPRHRRGPAKRGRPAGAR